MDNTEIILVAIVIGILLLFSVMGYFKGSIKILVSFGSLFLSLILVFVIYPTATSMFSETKLYDTVEEKVGVYVEDNLKLNKLTEIEQTGIEAQEKIIDDMPLPKGIAQKLKDNNNEETYKELDVDNFESYVKAYMVREMMKIISFAIVFIVVHILIVMLALLTQIAKKLPGVEFADRTLGVIIGLVEGYIFILVFCIIITALSGVSGMEPIFNAIHNNKILNTIYENNFIMTLILKFM